MKLFCTIIIDSFKIISRRKMYSALILAVLTVSFTCSLFMMAMGNYEMKKREENSVESRTLFIEISETDREKIKCTYEAVSSLYEFNSCVVTGNTVQTVKEYSNAGTKLSKKFVGIASDFNGSPDNFRWTLALPEKIEQGKAFITSNAGTVTMTDEPIVLNGEKFTLNIDMPSHKYFDVPQSKEVFYFLNIEDFFAVAQNYTGLSFTFSETPSEETLENVLNIICENVETTDIKFPEKSSGMQVERTKFFFALILLLLSFVNVKSAFLFLCSSRKTEYRIYRKYGATKSFLRADVFGMIFIFSIIALLISVSIYGLMYPLLSLFGIAYPINIFTVGILFAAVLFMNCISAYSCIKEVNKYETR